MGSFDKFIRAFGGQSKAFLPVIHVHTLDQALENAEVAWQGGADGVFLITHTYSLDLDSFLEIYENLRLAYPERWIGLNLLQLPANHAVHSLPQTASGLWTDNAQIEEGHAHQFVAKSNLQGLRNRSWSGLYFGGVAFKYQQQPADLAQATATAAPLMDVITTSGDGTGRPPELEKLRQMATVAHDHDTPLAVASGVSIHNVKFMLPYVYAFLVASSLLIPHTEDFDPDKLAALAKAIHGG